MDTAQTSCEALQGPEATDNAEDLFQAELRHINEGRATAARNLEECSALAFSGGGIRSASFGLGVMQALVARDKLQYMDYLSSVSGGSYISSSLTWYLSQKNPNGEARFNCRDRFPFGRKNSGDKNTDSTIVNILNYLRLHGNYLAPGKGLGMLAFIATMLRVVVSSFLIYLALLTLLFVVVKAGIAELNVLKAGSAWLSLRLPEELTFLHVFIALFALAAAAFVLVSMYFSLRTFSGVDAYRLDVKTQVRLGALLRWSLAFLLLGLLPVLHEQLGAFIQTFVDPDPDPDAGVHGTVAAASSALGALFGVFAHLRAMRGSEGVSTLQINLAAFFLLFGMLFGAYVLATYWTFGLVASALLIVVFLVLACSCNVNLFGLNRMYRNRLMETFMQAPEQVDAGIWAAATAANKGYVADMCRYPNNRPYHLINCNIVLVDSDNAHYRGRKGDCFVFSPLYTGSDATGWRRTASFASRRVLTDDKGMTLPTAMAISGAAANPYGGMAGQGPTTDKTVSLVMSMLSLRLGFWAENPRNEPLALRPNYLVPGLQGTAFFGAGLTETQRYIELSDGGHFENLAIYELLRRRVKLIIVSDAGQDGLYTFSDLANAVEKARVDFGIHVDFDKDYDLEGVMPGSRADQSAVTSKDLPLARRGFALARIYYARTDASDAAEPEGYLVYIKPTLIPGLGADVLGYRRQHPTYPHESTIDQFFDEVQFEAYRELGYRTGMALMTALESAGPDGNATLWNVRKLLRFE